MEPTPVALRSYGGGKLPIVRQVKVALARPGHQVNASVQVQREAPAKLLVGTDLLPQLGFLYVRTELEREDVDLLGSPVPDDVAAEEESTAATPAGGAPGTVCLLQGCRPLDC